VQTDVAFAARFTVESRRIIYRAQVAAEEMGHPAVGTEDLLVAMVDVPSEAGRVLARVGADAATVRSEVAARTTTLSDDEALAVIGIDAAAVRARLADVIGPSAIEGERPWTELARQVLLDAADAASAAADRLELPAAERVVGTDFLFLALLRRDEGAADAVVHALGVDRQAVRDEVARRQPMLARFRRALLANPVHGRYRAALDAYAHLSPDQRATLQPVVRDLHAAHDRIVTAAVTALDEPGADEGQVMAAYFAALAAPVEDAWLAFEAVGVTGA
jgi:ATP-dependent Clp protease ATP-binding subunit ClpA